jgi:hypothetical protein
LRFLILRAGPHRWFFSTAGAKAGVNMPGRRWHRPFERRNVLSADVNLQPRRRALTLGGSAPASLPRGGNARTSESPFHRQAFSRLRRSSRLEVRTIVPHAPHENGELSRHRHAGCCDGVDGAPTASRVPRWMLSPTHLRGAVHPITATFASNHIAEAVLPTAGKSTYS